MISKRIDGRRDGRSSAADALSYGQGLTPDKETGELLEKSHRTRFGNFGLVDDGVYGHDGQDMAELIELAAIEMQTTMDLNTRVATDKKLAHFVVSFNQEKPSEAVLRDSEESMLSALRLDHNHFVTFTHNDNGHWHLHVFASRISKGTHLGNPLWRDKTIRDRVCREIEVRHRLTRDNGLHEINHAGQLVEIPREERKRRREQKSATGISDRSRAKEIYSGEKSFQTWAEEIRIGDRLNHAKSWQDLHAAAAAYGCEVKPKGAGYVICPLGQKGAIQLSKVGLKNLPARFGAFEEAKAGHSEQPEASYKPSPTNSNGEGHYAKWQAAKKEYQPAKVGRVNALREAHKSERKALKDKQQAELKAIRATTKGAEKYAAVSVAKMCHAIDSATFADRLKLERQALYQKLAAEGPGNTFRDYLVREAGKGNNVALGLARRYGADEATEVSRRSETEKLQIRAAVAGNEYQPASRMRFTHHIERSGTVVYNLGNGRVVTDSATSKQIQLNNVAANDPAAIATSLRFAAAKFGNTLTLTGSPEFQKLAVETAVRERLGVRFADPALEAYREKLVEQHHHRPTIIQEKCHAPIDRIKHLRQVPPAHLRDRLRQLSPGNLVLDTERDDLPLRTNVSHRMEQQQEGGNQRVQRAAGRSPGAGTATTPRGASRTPYKSPRTGADQPAVLAVAVGESGQRSSGGERIDVPVTPLLSCKEWFSQQNKPVGPARQSGDGKIEYVIAFIAYDGIVVDHGRTVAKYQAPTGLELQAGSRIVIGKDGAIMLPHNSMQRVEKGR